MIYEIKGKYLEVLNEVKEYGEIIFGRFSQFEIVENKVTNNSLVFKEASVEINLDGNRKVLKNKIVKTDIYPIINNVIAYLVNDGNNIYMHSIVVSKNNIGILIVGNFGQGKTTLAEEFKKNKYEINSTDQTWLEIKENNIYQKLGSRFYVKEEKVELLEKNKVSKSIKIEKVIRILGICDNGKPVFNFNENKYHIIKNLSYFCNWNYVIPIFTDDVELYNTNLFVKEFLNKLAEMKIQFIDVRGDKTKIIEELGE